MPVVEAMPTFGSPVVPLCVDLDGTLVRTDMLHETALELLKSRPQDVARFPGWLAGGKAALKQRIAERVVLDVSHLPYRSEVLKLIGEARAQNRPVVLATAAAPQIAKAVADHLGVFDLVLSSDQTTNLSAHSKAQRLVELFGEGGFDYIGDARVDLPVWRKARKVVLVSDSDRLYEYIRGKGLDVHRVNGPKVTLTPWLKCLRPHQWLKNLLVFVPVFAAQKAAEPTLLLQSLLAFVAFSLAASFGYLVNDLLDLPADRRHARKRSRPFASGTLSISNGVTLSIALLTVALAFASLLPNLFRAIVILYLILTLSYSLLLKKQVVVDVMLLAGLYTLRVIAGGAATTIVPSFWLLAFSMFVFLSLAIVKRYSELLRSIGEKTLLAGRGYMSADLPVLMALGASSGLMGVMVLALYIDSPVIAGSYREPLWLWLMPPMVLYWVARLWMKTHRGEVHDDPVVFAAFDKQSLIVATVLALILVAAAKGINI